MQHVGTTSRRPGPLDGQVPCASALGGCTCITSIHWRTWAISIHATPVEPAERTVSLRSQPLVTWAFRTPPRRRRRWCARSLGIGG